MKKVVQGKTFTVTENDEVQELYRETARYRAMTPEISTTETGLTRCIFGLTIDSKSEYFNLLCCDWP